MSERGQKAYDYFMQGYNCAQAVLLAFGDLTGLDEKTAALVASGFGAGIGKTRNVCGTVTGMIMAADLINGYENPKDSNAKKYDEVSIQEVIDKNLQVVDITASILARDNEMEMYVFSLNEENSIVNTVRGNFHGTRVTV